MLLAVPTLLAGKLLIHSVHEGSWLGASVFLAQEGMSPLLASLLKPPPLGWAPTIMGLLGLIVTWIGYIKWPALPAQLSRKFAVVYQALKSEYGFDAFNQRVFVVGAQRLAKQCARLDVRFVDQQLVHGAARMTQRLGRYLRGLQSGYLNHYLLIMFISLSALLLNVIFRA